MYGFMQKLARVIYPHVLLDLQVKDIGSEAIRLAASQSVIHR